MSLQHAKESVKERLKNEKQVFAVSMEVVDCIHAIISSRLLRFVEELEKPVEGEVKPDVFRDIKIAMHTQSELDEAVRKAKCEVWDEVRRWCNETKVILGK